MQALIRGVTTAVPEASSALSAVFMVFSRYKEYHKDCKFDWSSCQVTLQKLADMNLRLLLKIDVQGTLGNEGGTAFLAELDRMTRMFQTSAHALEWLKLGSLLI